MKSVLTALFCSLILWGCHSNRSQTDRGAKRLAESVAKTKAMIAKGELTGGGDDEPTYDEEAAETLKSYNEIKRIDTLIIDGDDSLHVHVKHYCLHDSSLTVPKSYMSAWGKEHAKDFVTHNYATKILILNNKDTILNKVFKKKDFDPVIRDQLKQYAILMYPSFSGFKKAKGGLIFGYPISIPMTDVGVAAYLVIDKKGNYKILDEYAKID